jgi:hypothetical protein
VGTLSRAAPPAPQATGFRRLWVVLKQLFHEVTGAVFGVLAITWLNSAVRAWSRDVAHWLIALAVCVAGLFGFFSVTQFVRARKVR